MNSHMMEKDASSCDMAKHALRLSSRIFMSGFQVISGMWKIVWICKALVCGMQYG